MPVYIVSALFPKYVSNHQIQIYIYLKKNTPVDKYPGLEEPCIDEYLKLFEIVFKRIYICNH